MKIKIFLPLLILTLLFSCKNTDDPRNPEFPIQYYLTGYEGSFTPNPIFVPVTDSLYFYNLNENGSFQKQIGEEVAVGTYTELILQDEIEMLELTFDDPESNLIHSCYFGQELFAIQPDESWTGQWQACDGPILFFQEKSMIEKGG